jgi:hypothetical protein
MDISPLLVVNWIFLGSFGAIVAFYSLKLLRIKKKGMVNLLAKPDALKRDTLILILASALGVYNFVNYFVSHYTHNQDLFEFAQVIGIIIGFLYTLVIVRWERRFKV